jgi:hypothetical protein
MYAVSIYKDKDKSYPYPSDYTEPRMKGKEWCKKWLEAIYADYVRDRSFIPYSRRTEYQLLRLRHGSAAGGEIHGYPLPQG